MRDGAEWMCMGLTNSEGAKGPVTDNIINCIGVVEPDGNFELTLEGMVDAGGNIGTPYVHTSLPTSIHV